jgi:hypothetical protein
MSDHMKRWNLQVNPNPWFSLGIHVDHTDPSVIFHLPGLIVQMGRIRPIFKHSLRVGRVYDRVQIGERSWRVTLYFNGEPVSYVETLLPDECWEVDFTQTNERMEK